MKNKFQQAHAKPIPLTSEQKAAYPIIYSELFLQFMQSAKQLAPQLQKEHNDDSLTPEAVAVAGLVGYDLEEPKFNQELLTCPPFSYYVPKVCQSVLFAMQAQRNMDAGWPEKKLFVEPEEAFGMVEQFAANVREYGAEKVMDSVVASTEKGRTSGK